MLCLGQTGLSRRELLRIGAVGFAGLTLPALLRTSAQAAPGRPRARSLHSTLHVGRPGPSGNL